MNDWSESHNTSMKVPLVSFSHSHCFTSLSNSFISWHIEAKMLMANVRSETCWSEFTYAVAPFVVACLVMLPYLDTLTFNMWGGWASKPLSFSKHSVLSGALWWWKSDDCPFNAFTLQRSGHRIPSLLECSQAPQAFAARLVLTTRGFRHLGSKSGSA